VEFIFTFWNLFFAGESSLGVGAGLVSQVLLRQEMIAFIKKKEKVESQFLNATVS